MSTIHQLFSEFLKDVEDFCLHTLAEEQLSIRATTARDKLITKISSTRNAHIQLQDHEVISEPSSPPPYLDMKGNTNVHTEYVLSDPTEEHYELCQVDSRDLMTNIPLSKNNSVLSDDCKTMTVVSASDVNDAIKKGFLDKKSRGLFNQYQKRWCAIKDGILYYFTNSNDSQQCGFIVITGYEVRNLSTGSKEPKDNKRELGFELVCPGKRTYQFLAPSKNELEDWMNVIEKVSALKNDEETFSTDGISTLSSCHDDIYESVEEGTKPNIAKDQKDLYDDAKSVQQKGVIKPEEWYLGKWECVADEPNELSFKSGDLIRIVSKEYDNHLWWIGDINGSVGLVPKNYLIEAYEIE